MFTQTEAIPGLLTFCTRDTTNLEGLKPLVDFWVRSENGFKNHIFLSETGLGFQEMCRRCHENFREYLPGLQS